MSSGIYEMLIPYDTLVAAVREALPGYCNWVELDEKTMTGCTVFKLSYRELGDDLGEVSLRKVGAGRTELFIQGPRLLLSRQPTQEEKDALKAIHDKDERLQQELDLLHKIDNERDELHRRRKKHFRDVIQTMFNRLYHDTTLRRALQAAGNELMIKFLARLAGEGPQADGGAVAEQPTPAEDEEGKMGIFFSYAHEDEELRDELQKHLSILERQGVITSWHDRKIGAGKEWKGEIDTHLNTARLILLLISSDFIASDYCWGVEVKRAMERHEAGEARVIPVILRPVDWKSAPFGKLQALPTDAKPVTTWSDRDEAFFDVAQGIRAAVVNLGLIEMHGTQRRAYYTLAEGIQREVS